MLKNTFLYIAFFCFLFFKTYADTSLEQSSPKKTVCLNMIVKNESKVIVRCLESVKHLIDYWVIVDTGSTDGTQEIIKNFLKDIPGELYERPWVNFADNRNEALVLAKNKGDSILLMDADEKLVYSDDFKGFPLEDDYSLIALRASTPNIVGCQRLLLINNHLDWKWKGVLHEFLITPPDAKKFQILKNVSCFTESDGFRAEDPKKYQKDAAVLEKALETEPANSRYVFYLGQSYLNAGEYELAIKNYEKRAKMEGDAEEVFVSLYLVGRLKEILKKPFQEIEESYSAAFQHRPIRAEPLYRLGGLFLENQNPVQAYALFKLAASIPMPDDFSFMERSVYEYAAAFELARAAALIGQEKESLERFETLQSNPHLPEILKEKLNQNISYLQAQIKRKSPIEKVAYNIEKHFKKLGNKTPSTRMKNIDFIYLINLDQRPERLNHCLNQLAPYGIEPYRFPAVYGWGLPSKTINDLGLQFMPGMRGGKEVSYYPLSGEEKIKKTVLTDDSYGLVCFHSLMTPGAIGCTLSHLSVLQDAYDSGYEAIWLLEDDFHVVDDPHKLSDAIDRLDLLVGKDNWDVLYTDHDKSSLLMYAEVNDFDTDLKGIQVWAPNLDPSEKERLAKRTILNDEFMKVGSRWWAHSLIIRRSGMKKILDYKKTTPVFNGYDVEIALTPDIQMYMLRHNIVTFSGAFVSDTGIDHLNKKEKAR